jgi:hypothetical protein
MTEEEKVGQGISRRSLLKRAGVAGAVAWTTPVIASLRTPAFAASPGPNPECIGADCANFSNCGANAAALCVCFTTDIGGFCLGSEPCADLVRCPNGTGDCPAGTVCLIGSCCGENVCSHLSLADACNTPGAAPARSAGGLTTSGR